MIKKISMPLLASMMLVAVSAILLLMEDQPVEAAFLSSGVGDPFVVNNLTVQTNATVGGTLSATGGFSGNASTATALATNGANCSTGYYPLGVNASGAVESCTAIPEVTGLPSGSSGQTLRHNGTSWVGNTVLYNNGTNVGIGTTAPGQKLQVVGTGLFSNLSLSADNTNRGTLFLATAGDFGHALYNNYSDVDGTGSFDGARLNGYYGVQLRVGANGGTLGVAVAANGNVGIGTTSTSYNLQTAGTGYFGGTVVVGTPTASSHATTKGYVDSAVGSISDVYWTGTATNLNAATGRTSLGLGSLATLSAVASSNITDGTIVDADISASAAISASKIANGTYFITSAGTSGQVWTSDGSGAGAWVAPTSGVGGSGTASYLSRWTGSTALGNSVIYDSGTNIGIGTTNPTRKLQVTGDIYASGVITAGSYFVGNLAGQADYAYALSSNGSNCSSGYYPLGIDMYGNAESCTVLPGSSDIYWTGTATNLNAATGRTSLGLGSLATLSSVSSANIDNATIVDADISSSAAISASKIVNGTYFITSAGTSGQIWTSDGSGAGYWTTPAASGVSGSGTSGYIPKWNGSSSLTNSIISDNGSTVSIAGDLTVSGVVTGSSFVYSDRRLKQDISPLSSSLEKIKSIQPVSFRWKKDNRADIGVIAQDLEKIFPELVITNPDSGFKAVNYSGLVPVLVSAIKQQQGQIDELRAEISSLKK